MKYIVRQALTLAGFVIALYGLALLIALPAAPRPVSGSLDTAAAARSAYLTEPKYAFLSRGALDSPDDKLILLGASNVLAGFRPAQLQRLLPGRTVHNLAIGGANVTEVGQMADLVLAVQGAAARRHNVFAIGLWYGLFAADRARWYTPDRHPGDTDLDIERYRYGFYRRTARGPVPLLPPRWLDAGVTLIAPFLLLDRWARDAGSELGLGRARAAPGARAAPPDVAAQAHYLAFWNDYMGGSGQLDAAPFDALAGIVDRIVASGGRVLLLDLPLPRWHAEASPYEASYRHRLRRFEQQLAGHPGVVFLDMGDADRPADFVDEVHPRPAVTGDWAARLAGALNARTAPVGFRCAGCAVAAGRE